jgi:hypothetical protein
LSYCRQVLAPVPVPSIDKKTVSMPELVLGGTSLPPLNSVNRTHGSPSGVGDGVRVGDAVRVLAGVGVRVAVAPEIAVCAEVEVGAGSGCACATV